MPTSRRPPKPGRPKDLEKRAAILDAAKRLFPAHGFESVSMDAIAREAGVSKLTVYSHFNDKDSLFSEAIRQRCEEQLPDDLFVAQLKGPLRSQLRSIAEAFFKLIMSEEALGLQRMLAQQRTDSGIAQLFWDAGPRRIQAGFAQFLQKHVNDGALEIDDVRRAASQFFCLLKGEIHAQEMFGCCGPLISRDIEAHLDATVDFFLRGYVSQRN